jgi:hypothetical protein
LNGKKLVSNTQEYKYNDVLTAKARSFDKFETFEKANRLQK